MRARSPSCRSAREATLQLLEHYSTAVYSIAGGVNVDDVWKVVESSRVALDDQKLPGKQSSDVQRFEKAERIVGAALNLVHLRHRSVLQYDGLRFPPNFSRDILNSCSFASTMSLTMSMCSKRITLKCWHRDVEIS